LAALICAWTAHGDEPVGKLSVRLGLDAAYEAAQADHSLVLLVFGAEWCGPCKMLQKDTLDASAFLDHAGALELTHVDIDANAKLAADFKVEAVPTLVLLTSDQKIVERRTGYLTAEELLKWLEEGRRRVAQGQWEGTAPGSALVEISRKAADGLEPAEIVKLVGMLDNPDPGERGAIGKIILGQREPAVPALIDAVTNEYLGIRIAAIELLHKLAPTAVAPDPWQSPVELQGEQASLRKWWSATGKLPRANESVSADPAVNGSISGAIRALSGDDPVRRTEAMSALVADGDAALPAVRDALRSSLRSGDHRAASMLEDVRWAILIPDSLEQHTGGVRAALARGASAEQQSAATRLGLAGREAIPALAELADEADPLVVEKAVRALSAVGGKDAIPAMAALLKAGDSNLRITAAQALAHTKNTEAIPHLLTIVDDPNEIVACAALAGLEEIIVGEPYSGAEKTVPPEVVQALKHSLTDTRWRVRAASAEAIGKMRVSELAPDMKTLLEDPDGFVVKTALTALETMSAQPGAEQLAALSRRLPSLRGDAVKMMVQDKSPETVNRVTEIYNSSKTGEQEQILAAIATTSEDGAREDTNELWKPLLAQAATSTDPRVRQAAAKALGVVGAGAAAELTGNLLGDEDADTRAAAAEMALGILLKDRGEKSERSVTYFGGYNPAGRSKAAKTNQPAVSPERLAGWHASLLRHTAPPLDPIIAIAIFATGDGKTDLPLLATTLENMDAKGVDQLQSTEGMKLLLPKLSPPEGQMALEKIQANPRLLVIASADLDQASPAAGFLLEPAHFCSAIERANGTDLDQALRVLLKSPASYEPKTWSLLSEDSRAASILNMLATSTNAAWHAGALYALGRRGATNHLARFESATNDASPWVRAAAAQGLAHAFGNNQTELENRLGPFLADAEEHVAEIAAVALIQPEIRNAANLNQLDLFAFEKVRIQPTISRTSDERPLTRLENKPAFLEQVRHRPPGDDKDASWIFALLLAEYGEFDGLDKLVAGTKDLHPDRDYEANSILLAGITLSRDARYIPLLRKLAEQDKTDWDLRAMLKAVKGMSGPDARQFRLDINKQIRKTGGNSND